TPRPPKSTPFPYTTLFRSQPNNPPAPAEPRDAEFLDVPLAGFLHPGDSRIEVGHHLGVGHLRDHFGNDVVDIRQLRHSPLPCIELWSNSQVAQLGQPAADILDVFMDAKDLLDNYNHRKSASF